MRPADIHRVSVAAVLAFVVLLAGGMPTASADPAPPTAGEAAASVVCAPLTWLPGGRAGKKCEDVVQQVWTTVEGPSVTVVCRAILGPTYPLLGTQCESAVASVLGQAASAAKAAVDAAGAAIGTAVAAVKFVANPAGVVDEWANANKSAAIDLTEQVMLKANAATASDFQAGWFTSYYAGAFALGLVVMAVMLLLLYHDVGRGKVAGDEFAEAMLKAPVVVVVMGFTPALTTMLAKATQALADGIAGAAATQVGGFIGATGGWWAAFTGATAATIPGGSLVGLLVFGLMALGALSTLAGLVMQQFGGYLAVLVMGIGWGMWVHPIYRPKARRVWVFFVALMLQKPAFWFLLGAAFLVLNHTPGVVSADPVAILTALMGIVMVLLMVGLAPWALLKYFAALMPGGNEHQRGSGGHVTEAALAGAAGGVGSVMMQRAWSMGRDNGGGGSAAAGATSTGGTGAAGSGGATSTGGGAGAAPWQARATGTGAGQPATGGRSGPAAATGARTAGGGAGAAVGAAVPVIAAQAGMGAVTGTVSRARRIAEEGGGDMGREDNQ